jgi:glycosyltransferase involved in cell wall biosynthesis
MDRRADHAGALKRTAIVHPFRTLALLPGGDRFEDFFDKIGVSLETFRDEFTGGWLFNYAHALRRCGVRTVLIYMSARVEEPQRFTHVESGVTVWMLPSPHLHRKLRNARYRYAPHSTVLPAAASYLSVPLGLLRRVLRDERCDAILCQEYEHPRFDVCVLLGRLLRLPVFATYQGANETRTWVEAPIRPLSVRRAAGLIIPSLDEIVRVTRSYRVASHRIGVIPNPVEIVPSGPASRQAVRAELGIGSATRVVAWHGRVQIHKKGLDVLADAWDRVCSARPQADILLLLVGTGRDADDLHERLGSNRRVRWIDRYVFRRQQLWSYLQAADIYAMPSRYEGFAVAILEAMACGLAVVASDVSGVAEALGRGEADGGLLVPCDDAPALAAALLRLMDDPELARRLGDRCRRHIEAEYSLEVVGPKLRAFLFPDQPA